MKNWLFDKTNYTEQETSAHWHMLTAFEEARSRKKIRLWDRQLLRTPGIHLCAVGKHGRIAWAKAVCRELQAHFKLGPGKTYPGQPLYFLTLTDIRCSTAHDAANLDVAPFIRLFRKGLAGYSYFGMLEPAYYVNIAEGARYKNKRAMSWHVHAVLWGLTRDEAKALEANLNKKFKSIADGLDAARIKRIIKNETRVYHLGIKLKYMLKSPKRSYRLRKNEQITGDGEIITQFESGKSPLRSGERVALFHIMKHMYMDGLALTGGNGVAILRKAKRQATRTDPKPTKRILLPYSGPVARSRLQRGPRIRSRKAN